MDSQVLTLPGTGVTRLHLPLETRIARPTSYCELLQDPIYENGAFRFFAVRMEAWDVYAGTYRSTNGITITKDNDPSYTWTNALLNKLYLQTPFPILDACYALGVSEMFKVRALAGTTSAQLAGDQPGGQYYVPFYYMTHGSDIREHSRDSAQHIQLAYQRVGPADFSLLPFNLRRGTSKRAVFLQKKACLRG